MLMLGKFRQWLHDTLESPRPRQNPRQGQRVLPRLEMLEAREVPATFNVNNAQQLLDAINAAAKTSAAADVINIRVAEIDMSGFDAFVLTGKGGALTIRSVVGNTTISQDGDDRIFVIEEGAKVTLSRLTIQGGYADTDSDFGAQGGGILSFGTLSIANSIITNNLVDGDGGEGSDNAIGGGIASYGQLTVTNSTIRNNTAEAGSDFFGGCEAAPYALGGGVAHFEGKLTITNTKFLDNEALGGFSDGGEGSDAHGGYAAGGGLYAGAEGNLIPSITITNSLFDGNEAIGGNAFAGGEGDARGGDAFGGGAALGGPLNSKFADPSTASISISNTVFEDNLAQGGEAEGDTFSGSKYEGGNASGGGLFFTGESTVVLSKDQFLDNHAVGGEANFSGSEGGDSESLGGSGFGGGVAAGTLFDLRTGCEGFEDLSYFGTLTITSNIFTDNTAEGGFAQSPEFAVGGAGYGGGLGYSGGGLTQITSSTLTANQALGAQAEQDGDSFDGTAVLGGAALGGGIFYNTVEDCSYGKDDAPPVANILNIKNSTLQDNEALGGAAEIDFDGVSSGFLGLGGQANGGGLFLGGESSVTITGTTKFNRNHATGGLADVSVEFSGGEGESEGALGGGGFGGAISAGGGLGIFSESFDFYGSLTITTGTFTGNTAEGGEAVLEIEDFDVDTDRLAGGGQGAGGALFIRGFGEISGASTTTTVTGSTFSGNQALGGAATIDGLGDAFGGAGIGGAIAHGAEEEFDFFGYSERGGSYYGSSTLSITTTTISNNTAQGGLAAVESENFSFDEATGGDGIGGGLYTDPYVRTTISRSTFDNNDAIGGNADNFGDADLLFGGNGLGGGLALGTNDSCDSGPRFSGGEGGDDYQLSVFNSTFTLNEARGGDAEDGDEKSHGGDGLGGGLFLQAGSYARIVNATIARNDAVAGEADEGCDGDGRGGGLYSGDECEGCESSGIEVLNTLIALNDATDDGPDVFGAVFSLGFNLIFDSGGSCGFDETTDFLDQFTEAQLRLGQLASNGGPTKTLALLSGSAAINKGSNIVLSAPFSFTVDQRGHLRKAGPRVDIGAYEFGSAFLGRGQP